MTTIEQRSQTPSPHFGSLLLQKTELRSQQTTTDNKNVIFGSGSTQASSEHVYGIKFTFFDWKSS